MSKKISAFLMALILLLSMLGGVPAVALTEDAYFEVEMPALASIKSELTVNVVLKNNPGISGGVLQLNFDRSVFTLTGVAKGSLCAENDSVLLQWHPDKNDIAFAAPEAVTGDGALLQLKFRVADSVVAGDYTVTVSARDLEDGALNGFTATAASETVRLLDYLWGDADGNKVTNVADVQTILKWKIYLLEDNDLNMPAADADRSGTEGAPDVGIPDALILLQWMAGYVEWDPIAATPPPAGV